MEQIIKQNTFSRTVFNDSKLGAYYTDPVHATKIGRLFRLQGECCVLEPSFGNAEALKAFLSQCERADEVGSVHTFGVELNRETFEQYKQEIEFPVCADFIGGIRASNRSFTLCFANPPYGVGGDDGSTRLERLFVERIFQLMKTKGYLVLVVSLTTMNLDEFAKSLLARFKPVAFYRFDDEEFAKYKQVVFIGQKRASIGLYRKEYEEWMSTNPGAPLENIPYIPKDPDTRMEVPVSLESEIELFTTKEFDLLTFLAENPNHVFTKDELFSKIWDMESIGDIATVTVHIKKIREKIEFNTAKPQYIETIWGVGYRFKL